MPHLPLARHSYIDFTQIMRKSIRLKVSDASRKFHYLLKYSGYLNVSPGMSPGMSLAMSLGKRSGTFIQKLLVAGYGALDLFRSSSFA